MTRKNKKNKKQKTRKYKGGTRKSPLGLRRLTLQVPTNTVSGAFKTIWKVPESNYVVINSTQEQAKEDKTPYLNQLQEFAFSKRLNVLYPQFFPKVSSFKGDEKELKVIDQLKNIETSDKRLKYIWLKENCPPPSDEEIQTTYLKKAIQLLMDLMEQGLCYIDIKPMNIGKRGQEYVVIDTGREDIYYIPKDYKEDYLKGEILICGMSIYHYLKDKGLPIPYEEILSVFSLIIPPIESQENFIDTPFKDKLQAYLEGKTIKIQEHIEDTIRRFRTRIYRTYLNEEQKQKILDEQKKDNNLNNKDDIYMISARLNDYAKLNQIGQFFRDKIKDKSTPLAPLNLDFLNE